MTSIAEMFKDAKRVFRALGAGHSAGPVAATPRAAAVAFFARYPGKRKCDVSLYMDRGDGGLTMVIGLARDNPIAQEARAGRFQNVTPRMVATLPDVWPVPAPVSAPAGQVSP
jgi:hypothetical protein